MKSSPPAAAASLAWFATLTAVASLALAACSPDPQSDALSDLASRGYELSIDSYHRASATGDVAALALFQAAGMSIDLPQDPAQPHMTTLRTAVAAGQEPCFQWLLEHGASLATADAAGVPLLQLAVEQGHLGLVDALLSTYPDHSDSQRDLLLRLAIDLPAIDILDHLLPVNDRPLTVPLLHAAETGRVAAVDLLYQKGADPHAADPDSGATALHLAAAEGHAEMVEFLLQIGVDRFAMDHLGQLPADLAQAVGHPHIAHRLWQPPANTEREMGVLPGTLSPDSATESVTQLRSAPLHDPGSPRTLWPLNGARIGHQSGLFERPPLEERLVLQTVRPTVLPIRLIKIEPDHVLFEDLHHPGLGQHASPGQPIGLSGFTFVELRPITPTPTWLTHFALLRHDATGTYHPALPGVVTRTGPLCATLHVLGTDEFYEAHPGDTFHFIDLPTTPLTISEITPRSIKIDTTTTPIVLQK